MNFRCQQLVPSMWPVWLNYMSMTFASKYLPLFDPSIKAKQQNLYVLSTMKLSVLFLFLALAFDETESQDKVVCAKKHQVSSYTANRFFHLKFLFSKISIGTFLNTSRKVKMTCLLFWRFLIFNSLSICLLEWHSRRYCGIKILAVLVAKFLKCTCIALIFTVSNKITKFNALMF